ncbi:MAG: hypothetical protein ACOY31_10245 [Bacillota bacterium]
MKVFSEALAGLRRYVYGKKEYCREIDTRTAGRHWPEGGVKNIVMMEDTGVELGNPREESFSFILCVEDPEGVRDGKVLILGPDLGEGEGKSLPFGKVVIAAVNDSFKKKGYDFYRKLDFLKYNISLQGYMAKGLPRGRREWLRIGREALGKGLTLEIVGRALIDEFRKLKNIGPVEVLFVTSSGTDVQELRNIMAEAVLVVEAARKMEEEADYNCGDCDYKDVCSRMGGPLKIEKG